MTLADKIIKLRKQAGWSQEELAERLGVSRQAVSKWESAQATPDLDKILSLSTLFGVTTDYLLKDGAEEGEISAALEGVATKRISLAEATAYLDERRRAAWHIAIATFLCILSPITLILLDALANPPHALVSETVAGVVGLCVLFALVLCAVPLYLICGFKNEPYAFLDKSIPFVAEHGVSEAVAARKEEFQGAYVRWNIIATCLCILSPIPLIATAFADKDLLSVLMLAIMLVLAGLGVMAFIVVGVQNAAMQKLLRVGDYTDAEKARRALREAVGFAYWGILTAIFLVWSFMAAQWHISWTVFAVGGVLFPIVMRICDAIADRRRDR